MTAPESGIDLGFDILELDFDDFENILKEGSDDNGFYTLKSKPPVSSSPPSNVKTMPTTSRTQLKQQLMRQQLQQQQEARERDARMHQQNQMKQQQQQQQLQQQQLQQQRMSQQSNGGAITIPASVPPDVPPQVLQVNVSNVVTAKMKTNVSAKS
ncbi:probable serine/threonine-protein kinase pkgA [Palaemon carinicauda]|uniref:probable serine/threonine-protein kinase pkgA n=1 Tax=Palaemon carinicauda TaxID=392227 RepID=UPI0035B5A656